MGGILNRIKSVKGVNFREKDLAEREKLMEQKIFLACSTGGMDHWAGQRSNSGEGGMANGGWDEKKF